MAFYLKLYKKFENQTQTHKAERDERGYRINPSTHYTIPELANLIERTTLPSSKKIRDRALLSTLAIYGMRVSELVTIKKQDFKIEPKGKDIIIRLNVRTLKKRKSEVRTIPASYKIYRPLFNFILKHLDTVKDEQAPAFGVTSRKTVFLIVKATFGDRYFPHWFRHFSASLYGRAGYPAPHFKKRFGWAQIGSAEPYLHLNINDLTEAEHIVKRFSVENKVSSLNKMDKFIEKKPEIKENNKVDALKQLEESLT